MNIKKLVLPTVSAVAAAGLTAFAVSDMCLKTTNYKLKANTGTPFTVTVLSDLHFARFGKDNCRLIDAVKKTQPDIILLAGDFFDVHHCRSNSDTVKKLFCELCKIADVYMTPGNHDIRYSIAAGEYFFDCVRDSGVTLLNGEYLDIQVKGQNVRVGGIFDHSAFPEDYGKRWYDSEVYKFLKEFEQTDSIKLLMMHRPNTFIFTDDEWDIDAVFSGHDHGGIWQIPFIGGVYAPEQGFFPVYDKGEYTFGKMKMFLSAGLEGFYEVPRLFNRPEILKISVGNF